jgi:acetyl-CoA carboxylase biotin carboxyl carrier protein
VKHEVLAELVGTIHSVVVTEGSMVGADDAVVVLESMKMEIPVPAEVAGRVLTIAVAPGENVRDGDLLAVIDAN